jgi:hypothetical protein
MTTSFTYKVVALNHEIADGFVFSGGYTVKAHDGTYEAGAYANIEFERPETLIPFSSLEEETVIGWIKDKLGAEAIANIEGQLQARLDEQIAPTQATGLPWDENESASPA